MIKFALQTHLIFVIKMFYYFFFNIHKKYIFLFYFLLHVGLKTG